ncbi:MAG: GNAT family N-acetyltransferase [Pseudomonadota bacterium]
MHLTFDHEAVGRASCGSEPAFRYTPGSDIPKDLFNGNLYSHTAYRAAHGHDNPVLSHPAGIEPALFSDKRSHLVHLGRLDVLTTEALLAHAAGLFDRTRARFILFEDIRLISSTADRTTRLHAFRFKANWRRSVPPDGRFLTGKRASDLRRKARRLDAYVGGKGTDLVFERCGPETLDAITALNRERVESTGRTYRLTEAKQAALQKVCAEIGYATLLRFDDELIAGTVVCMAGRRGYVLVLGHDRRFEKFSPGLQAMAFTLQELRARGCTEVNFLWGDSRWKSDFGAVREELTTVLVRRNAWSLVSKDLGMTALPLVWDVAKASARPHVDRLRDALAASR